MANITVTSTGYWGDDSILASGSWAALVWNDIVTIQNGAVCNIDPAVRTPTGIDVGVKVVCTAAFSKLVINNQSTTTPLKLYGARQGTIQIESGCEWKVTGNYIQIGTGTGAQGQTINITSYGFDLLDVPAVIFVETAGVYEPWMNTGGTPIENMGVGTLGKWFEYDDTTGNIIFGDAGKPQVLTANASAGQNEISIVDTSDYVADDYIHLIDQDNQETLEIASIVGNTITCKSNLKYSYTTTNNAFIRLVKGGNIVPLNAKIRMYNTVVGTKNSSGQIVIDATIADNFELDTSKGGIVSFEKILFTGMYLNLAYPGRISINHISVINTIYPYFLVNQTFSNVYICPDKYSSTPLEAFQNQATTSHSLLFEDCIFATKDRARTIPAFPLSTFRRVQLWMLEISVAANRVLNSSGADLCVFEDVTIVGGISVTYTGYNQSFKNLNFSNSQNGIPYTFSANGVFSNSTSSINIDNFNIIPDGSSGLSVTFCYTSGILKNSTLGSNICTNLIALNTNSFKIMKCKLWGSFTGFPFNFSNSHFNVIVQNVHFDTPTHAPWHQYLPSKCIFKGFDTNTVDVTPGVGPTLDTHFYELRGPTNLVGIMGIIFNPKSSTGTGYTESDVDDLRWNNNGSMYIVNAGGYILYEWPHVIIGVTAFPSDGSVNIRGSGTGNFNLEYQINLLDGNGWTSLATLNHTNLSAHTIDPDVGFRFRVKISHSTGSTSDYLDRLNWTTTVDYDNYQYPEDVVNLTLQNIVDGSRYYVYNETTEKEIATGIQSGSLDIVIPDIPYNGVNETLLIRVRKGGGGLTDYKPFETNAVLTANGATVWISQVIDDLTT